jgi:hypothetical protein
MTSIPFSGSAKEKNYTKLATKFGDAAPNFRWTTIAAE